MGGSGIQSNSGGCDAGMGMGAGKGTGDTRRAWVQVRTADLPPVRVEVNGQPVRIGRAPGNGIVLADQFASALHAELVVHQGTRAVRDLGSSNGTLLNGRPLVPGTLHALRDGDTLQIGSSELVYHGAPTPGAAVPATPTPAPATPTAAAPAPLGTFWRSTRRMLLRLMLILTLVGVLVAGGAWLLAPSRVVVLVLGSDARPDELRQGQVGRTDTLLTVVADRELDGLTMISIPRDLWVPIPGFGEERINAAYTLGGARIAERTVSELLGTPVSRSLVIGLQGVRDVVDAAGGVEIDVAQAIHDDAYPTDDYGTIVLDIPAGRQWMDGETALRYARTRHQDSDFGRMARQQQVMTALRTRLLQPWNWWRLPSVLSAVQRTTQTNLGLTDLATLGLVVAQGGGPERLTIDLTLAEELRGRDGAYLLRPRPALKQRVGVLLGPASAGVEVLNGTLTEGVARQAAERLTGRGVRVVNVGNAPRPQPETTIEVCVGCARAGQLVATALDVPASAVRESQGLPTGTDVRVTIGR